MSNPSAMSMPAPIQLIAVGFQPDARFEGQIASALDDLEKRGSLRVLDLFFVRKDESGELAVHNAQSERLSGVLATALGLDKAAGIPPGPALSVSEIDELGAALEPGQAVGMVLIEHVWAAELMDAITATGGRTLASEFLSDESLAAIAADLGQRGPGDTAGSAG
jgi:uncharacterized membrane protein